MIWQTLPQFGTFALYAVLIAAAYTFGVSILAHRSRQPRALEAARLGAYGTVSLIGLNICILAYAFLSHDFRIRYVAHHSSRDMSLGYLVAALWGGQDGSMLWWLFLLSLYTGACVAWMKGRLRELQPAVIGTLMSIIAFFSVTMIFTANPFWTSVTGSQIDGKGLNPLLQDIYMIIHPPSLYTGFVGCSVPAAFGVAALVTGKIDDNEWLRACRKWALFAWTFLTIGNGLGMLWAYKELGWGGYWAWDPVENAACLPWFTMSAFLHSTMVQERRPMLKFWNVQLVIWTFMATIFGTFLTRSGMIASVHSFAQSDIGAYFAWYMAFILVVSIGLFIWRMPLLRSKGSLDSLFSREFTIVLNNWALLGTMNFIAITTVAPKISELFGQKLTVGPAFYNTWIPIIVAPVFFLMGAGTLFGWRKTSPTMMRKSAVFPAAAFLLFGALHLIFGHKVGFAPFVTPDLYYEGIFGQLLRKLVAVLPLVFMSLVGFNFAIVIQEYYFGLRGRASARAKAGKDPEALPVALFEMIRKNRRRYAGYMVHFGLAMTIMGFIGHNWGIDREVALKPGQTAVVSKYKVEYIKPRMEVDASKRMIFSDLRLTTKDGNFLAQLSPAKFIYHANRESPTTEIALFHTFKDDFYAVVGVVNPKTKLATFQFHINPLVAFVWLGLLVMIGAGTVAMWPELSFAEVGVLGYSRAAAGLAAGLMFSFFMAFAPGRALAQSSSLHAGTVQMNSPLEREVFSNLLCQCGSCARLPLSRCTCSTAAKERAGVRVRLKAGESKAAIYREYAERYDASALAVPPNKGAFKAIYAVPIAMSVLGAAAAAMVVRKWRANAKESAPSNAEEQADPAGESGPDEWDERLDAELEALDD